MLSGALLTVVALAYLAVGLLCAVGIEGYEASRGHRGTLRKALGRAFALSAIVPWPIYLVALVSAVGAILVADKSSKGHAESPGRTDG